MSLNDWSLVVFATTALLYMMLYWSVFRKPHLVNYILLIVAWAISVITNLVYGIATRQVGFILIFLMEIALAMAVLLITERSSHDN